MELLKTTFDTNIGKISCYKNDHYFYNSFSNNNPYEKKMIDGFIKPFIIYSDYILDIGSHIGYHSIYYSKINPHAKIMAFEPQKMVFNLLEENIKLNSLQNILPLNFAVSNKSGKFSLSKSISDGQNAGETIEYGTEKNFNLGGVSLGKDGEEVNTITIDSLNVEGLDFVKIDVEGAESLVLLGGLETLKKYKPVICFESNYKTITPEMKELFGLSDVKKPIEILKEIGYSVFSGISNDNVIAIYN